MSRRRWLLVVVLSLVLIDHLLPVKTFVQPVHGTSRHDWNARTFWFSPWGVSGVHKGIDIFARCGATVVAAQAGLVVYQGQLAQGGKVVLVVTPRGWLHYYAHLEQSLVPKGAWVVPGEPIGEVGDSGNAVGKPTHLHYAVLTLIPRPWEVRWVEQGWKRMFYRDPGDYLP